MSYYRERHTAVSHCLCCGEMVSRNRAINHGAFGKLLVTCGKPECQRWRKTQLQKKRRLRQSRSKLPHAH